MSPIRGTKNYIWRVNDILGKGASGIVYEGVNKNTGEAVAVKTFNQFSQTRPAEIQTRESDLLKKVNHENIVKLLAIEEEVESRCKVIVMELCSGGSLFTILEDPENAYGLQEEEFLLVVAHLTSGVKYLRDNNVVHRDLKPGNIVKFIRPDGRPIYKLTDFGAARELEEDQEFVSLYGTEEYLHPHMYAPAVLRKPVNETFSATVDLWSIGVTLYHVATGQLPFRPFGGRKNKETMYYITTKKNAGVISGVQSTERGSIEWSRELPKSCELSAGLKALITPILAGILEVDTRLIWNFDKYFEQVTHLLSKKIVHVFYLNQVRGLRIYLPAAANLQLLQERINEQTDVPIDNQILLYGESNLIEEFKNLIPYSNEYLHTRSSQNPIFLYRNDDNNMVFKSESEVPAFPSFSSHVSLELDANLAKTVCSIGHLFQRRIENLSRNSELVRESVRVLTRVIAKKVSGLISRCGHARELIEYADTLVDVVLRGQKTVNGLLGCKETSKNSSKRELENLQTDYMNNVYVGVFRLYQRVSEKEKWESTIRNTTCPHRTRFISKANILITKMRESWQYLLKDRVARNLECNDKQFHLLEKIKLSETGRQIKFLFEIEVKPSTIQLVECLADWYKVAQIQYLQARILDQDINLYKKKVNRITNEVCTIDASFHEGIANISRIICSANSKYGGRVKAAEKKKTRAILADIKITLGDFESDLNERSELATNQLCRISNESNDAS